MKILFTADWHIKLGQKNVPIEWQINRYSLLVDLLNQEESDLMIIGGDIFDKLPSLDELTLYFQLINKINKPTIIYSGNHEALGKHTTFLSKLIKWTNSINNKVSIIDTYYTSDYFNILPYNILKDFEVNHKKYIATKSILFTHVRGNILPHVTAEIPLELFDKWEIVFAGDLHSHSNSQRNIIYPGSPLTTNFHRTKVSTGYIIIDTNIGWEWKELKIPQLIRLTVSDPKLLVNTDFDHTIYEVEGNINELAKIENNDLLDKIIVSRETTSKLNLHKNMTMKDELSLYFKDVLGLTEKEIGELLSIYHAYIKNEME